MDDIDPGPVPQTPPAFAKSQAEIHVFGVHEELLVETTDLMQRRGAHQHERSADTLDIARLMIGEPTHGVTLGPTILEPPIEA